MNDLSTQTCLDFWREMQEEDNHRNATLGLKIKTWTIKDEVDIVIFALSADGKTVSDPILMVDRNGGRLLSDDMKNLFYDGSQIFVKFNKHPLQSIRIIVASPTRSI